MGLSLWVCVAFEYFVFRFKLTHDSRFLGILVSTRYLYIRLFVLFRCRVIQGVLHVRFGKHSSVRAFCTVGLGGRPERLGWTHCSEIYFATLRSTT